MLDARGGCTSLKFFYGKFSNSGMAPRAVRNYARVSAADVQHDLLERLQPIH